MESAPGRLRAAESGALIAALFRQVHSLSVRVQELEARLARNSCNNSKPPSSDGDNKPRDSCSKELGRYQYRMNYQYILTERRGRIGIVKFNRPERLNALSMPLLEEFYDAIERLNEDPAIGVIILTGEGRAFCAGLDVQDWQDPEPGDDGEPTSYRSQLRWLEMMRRSKPVVVAVNGLAVGGGLTVILSCDIRIASERAQFEERHVRVGLMPDMGSSRLLVQTVGLAHALRLQLTARRIDAHEAERIGLVTEVVAHDQLMDTAVALAEEIAAHPNSSLLATKQLVWDNMCETDSEKVLWREAEVEERLMKGPDFKEATRAFIEKRKPRFNT
ncbi:MAG: enoyl-CoA hydratase/isomerase family protein [Gammaproteobacteria bacterium]|jgi:enoyl-CoA hydratase/carnithine racemase|nr:enoyl-CoA hydratase/isomerase family protein [Gammaproteobacteria bacterium]MBP6051071.1 enoyl-CoA hydratase/isomerase family protein [Pseudomonadales bacterium]MBK6584175.1 enoyl-CoA hydratase/isomerase family protein [Gammaproteobacteria bacterium]MBK7168576.1 enoyl-CoA hydratase/isomerase family protein [Gammaproteobacteria bacterium]MBK7520359.1 enoyl-CoA hydratase/isomerase family protein [Gammaproteobacteria bacterium]